MTSIGTYAAAHPVTIGLTTYNTSTTGSVHYDIVQSATSVSCNTATAAQTGWRMPSVTDWRHILQGLCGGPSATSPVGIEDNAWYYTGTLDGMVSDINTACGNSALVKDVYYSSSIGSDTTQAWWYGFNYGKFGCTTKALVNKGIRAVFAF